MMDGFLTIEHVGKRFGAHQVLDDLCFTVPRGTVATLLGPSGCGKTTMLRAIAGLEGIDGGRIVLGGKLLADGRRVAVAPEKRGVGMVFQSYALWPHKTVEQNVALGLAMRGVDRRSVAGKVASMLALVGLPDAGPRYPGSLSGGQQQRVALARALALEPACLLFDEPLSNLDQVLRERMRFEIREILVSAGMTAVYVTHDQSEAMVISDQLLIMDHGRIVQMGPPDQVYRRPATRFVAEFLGSANLLPLDVAGSDPGRGVFVSHGMRFHGVPCPEVPQAALIAFRADAASLSDGPDGLEVVVESATFLGGSTQCRVRVGPGWMAVGLPGWHRLEPGQRIRIRLDPAEVVLVPG